MFKKAFSKSTNDNANPAYAFAAPSAATSSAQARKNETETFYKPLPVYSATASPSRSGNNSPAPPASVGSAQYNNPFTDPREIRTPSPNASPSNPLLAGQSPGRFENRGDMPPPSRNYPPRGQGMPNRGDSQSALLGDNRTSHHPPLHSLHHCSHQRSVDHPYRPDGERLKTYGPTASAAPIPSSQSLLHSPSQAAQDKAAIGAQEWAAPGFDGNPEADDYLHNPDPKRDRKNDHGGTIFTSRGFVNIGCLIILIIGIVTLFAGYPIITYYTRHEITTNGAYNLGGINSTGQVPKIPGFVSVIDPDTPQSALTRTGFDNQAYNLVFSDEFNQAGRTFYPGDDPFWTAVDLHYWPTGDFEWYDPSAITTANGNLVITMTQEEIHDLNFKSGMLQSWNQMCFQYSAYIEVRVSLPGTPAVGGFWPGVWMMGNLGRPGYGATTEGTWPYTYAACDLGTLKNQTNAAGTGPQAALVCEQNGGGPISYLPGQRLSACTCAGEDHPGPTTNTGRGVPEIDVIEAQTDLSIPMGQVSQSAQVAPFDAEYWPFNSSTDAVAYSTTLTKWNSYRGGQYQQAVSQLTYVQSSVYGLTSGQFAVYGFEYYTQPNNRNGGHITWVSQGKESWTMYPSAVGPNSLTQISQRLISEEPMAMVINFGMSNNFQTVDFAHLQWPAQMLVDYVRVYQRPDGKMGCDPADRPTANYINSHANAYNDANLTTWAAAGYSFPKNSLINTC